ncbi:DUF1599 domain-containing protein [Bacillus sp. MCCB 382]|uniref:nucleotide modification associated domain-containing protein n=1 Tax=Bacillus sp. MCCB 382 TaxID=2860197 RepID=UPI001C57CDD7|nr:DUF1599 domain-containing protein [Bacillus sp. MCCB 382]
MAKRIRVIKAELRSYWCADHIGEEFEVTGERENTDYRVLHNGSDTGYLVDKRDCEIVSESPSDTQAQRIESICNEVRDLLIRKNHDYGDSFLKQFAKYGVMSGMIRMDDKMRRLETLIGGEDAQVAESLEDTVADLAGYALLTLVELRKSAK